MFTPKLLLTNSAQGKTHLNYNSLVVSLLEDYHIAMVIVHCCFKTCFYFAGSVIKAWDIGVATMKRGEIAVLTCKSDYAYGDSGSPPKIPPGATLVFEVELFDWRGEYSCRGGM